MQRMKEAAPCHGEAIERAAATTEPYQRRPRPSSENIGFLLLAALFERNPEDRTNAFNVLEATLCGYYDVPQTGEAL